MTRYHQLVRESRHLSSDCRISPGIMDSDKFRTLVLVTLTIQNAGQNIVITQSRVPNEYGQSYNASVAVLVQEIIKCAISLILLVLVVYRRQKKQHAHYVALPDSVTDKLAIFEDEDEVLESGFGNLFEAVRRETYTADAIRMILPAALYVAQNHLQIIAASRIGESNRV